MQGIMAPHSLLTKTVVPAMGTSSQYAKPLEPAKSCPSQLTKIKDTSGFATTYV